MNFEEMEVIQDFGYPASSTDVSLSENKRYLVCAGVYKPSIRIYDLNNLALKTERHLESDPARVVPLVEDGTKLCVLRNDRTVEFHAKYGYHDSVRVPNACYDMCFNKFKAEVAAGGNGRNVYRFNLDQGRFLNSYSTGIEEICSIVLNTANGLICVGGSNRIEFIDQRNREIVKTVEYKESPTAVAFSDNGIDLGVGTLEGGVYFHDLRARKEVLKIEHNTGIKSVLFNGKVLVSMSRDALKCCNRNSVLGEYLSGTEMNCFECDRGVVFLGLDNGKMKTILSEELGETPLWCKVLEE